eukprot:gnl/TRDRNA2_/TRDRNA2_85111_c0_seq1.p1 gnl/TRDRNA2_/TRDRNA2_85111_c0~~gnl/TRDRNA2_/TRDRNA2_85111_c0_seq1.p1  ORF type:complete len:469 (-),score=42.63 gnl/TRDRNA2_/TRDRNA2_85111_c0_seq1:56-1402(-)
MAVHAAPAVGPWLLLVAGMTIPAVWAVDLLCGDPADCADRCLAAGGATASCAATTCDERFRKCVCPGRGEALRLDGRCTKSLSTVSEAGCAPAYDAHLTAAVVPSPEICQEDIARGNASEALVTVMRLCVASAMALAPSAVGISDAHLLTFTDGDEVSTVGEETGLLIFDLSFSFCSTGTATKMPEPAHFEQHFISVSQQYASFFLGTVRLLTLEAHVPAGGDVSTTSPLQRSVISLLPSPLPTDEPVDNDGITPERRRWLVVAGAFLAVALAALILSTCRLLRLRRLRRSGKLSELPELPDRPPPCGPLAFDLAEDGGLQAEQGTLVCARLPFAPAEVADNETLRESCLELAVGDVLEVVAGGGGWLFGWPLGDSVRAGYFPENRVSWLGRAMAEEGADTAQLAHLRSLGMRSGHGEVDISMQGVTVGTPVAEGHHTASAAGQVIEP